MNVFLILFYNIKWVLNYITNNLVQQVNLLLKKNIVLNGKSRKGVIPANSLVISNASDGFYMI